MFRSLPRTVLALGVVSLLTDVASEMVYPLLPLLLVALTPLLIASFAFNFNNYNLIALLTDGNPPITLTATLSETADVEVEGRP